MGRVCSNRNEQYGVVMKGVDGVLGGGGRACRASLPIHQAARPQCSHTRPSIQSNRLIGIKLGTSRPPVWCAQGEARHHVCVCWREAGRQGGGGIRVVVGHSWRCTGPTVRACRQEALVALANCGGRPKSAGEAVGELALQGPGPPGRGGGAGPPGEGVRAQLYLVRGNWTPTTRSLVLT